MKYRPEYPSHPFASIEAARAWVDWFLNWYNTQHLHSAIAYVTPAQRHRGDDVAILEARRLVFEVARQRCPQRWSRQCRSWHRVQTVALNPRRRQSSETAA